LTLNYLLPTVGGIGRLTGAIASPTRWNGVELRHLRALVAIAETGSFSEAANRLGYVQSTVSHHLVALEEAVGTRLVKRRRGAREASLTPAGETVALHARRVLVELGSAEQELAGGQTGRRVAVAVTSDVARILLPRIHRVAAALGISATTLELIGPDPVEQLESGACSLAALEPIENAELVSRPVLRDRFVHVSPPTRRARTQPVRRAELEGASLVVHRGRQARLLHALDLTGLAVTPCVVADTDLTTLELVAAGLGSALVPELALRGHEGRVHVRELQSDISLPPRVVALAWARSRELGADEQALVERLQPADELRRIA
jgi:DNA-binding transcriptional LysR family regulator